MRSLDSLSLAALAGLSLALAAPGCGPAAPEPSEPERLALELFRAAAQPERERLDLLFGPATDEAARAVLADSVERLLPAREPRIVGMEELDGPDQVVIDIEAGLEGGGSGLWSVQVETADGGWRISWFQGPGVEWPPSRRRRDEGLSSSPPVR